MNMSRNTQTSVISSTAHFILILQPKIPDICVTVQYENIWHATHNICHLQWSWCQVTIHQDSKAYRPQPHRGGGVPWSYGPRREGPPCHDHIGQGRGRRGPFPYGWGRKPTPPSTDSQTPLKTFPFSRVTYVVGNYTDRQTDARTQQESSPAWTQEAYRQCHTTVLALSSGRERGYPCSGLGYPSPFPRKDQGPETGVTSPLPLWMDNQSESITFPRTTYTGGVGG